MGLSLRTLSSRSCGNRALVAETRHIPEAGQMDPRGGLPASVPWWQAECARVPPSLETGIFNTRSALCGGLSALPFIYPIWIFNMTRQEAPGHQQLGTSVPRWFYQLERPPAASQGFLSLGPASLSPKAEFLGPGARHTAAWRLRRASLADGPEWKCHA